LLGTGGIEPLTDEIGQVTIDKKAKFGSHNYLRYFDGLNGKRGVEQADEKMPVVKEFQ
jgi:beta-mannosidase